MHPCLSFNIGKFKNQFGYYYLFCLRDMKIITIFGFICIFGMVLFDEINAKSIYTNEFYYDEIEGNSTDTDIDEPDSDQVDETFLDEIEGNSTDTDIDETDSDQTDAFFSDEIEGTSTDTDIDEPDSDQIDEADNPIYIPLCELNFVLI